MNILVIISEYLPDQNPNIYRWSAIAEHWARQGHNIHVLSAKRHDAPTAEELNGVNVHRAGQSTLLDWAYNAFKLKLRRGRPDNDSFNPAKKTSGLRLLLEKIVSLTWRTFYWPDGSCIWYFPARRKAKSIIKENRIDAIITVCYPFTGILIGRYLKFRFPKVQWIADIEDPFSISIDAPRNNHLLYQRLNEKQERKALDHADVVTMTNDVVADIYKVEFLIEDKITVIPPIWISAGLASASDFPIKAGNIHLAYIGAFYTGVREPGPLLQLFRDLTDAQPGLRKEMKLHLVGEIAPEFSKVFSQYHDLDDILVFHGLKSRGWVAQCMANVDILINVGNTTPFQLPSKVGDYYASGKPILNLCQIPDDSFKGFFSDYPLIHNFPLHEKNVAANLSKLDHFITTAPGQLVSTELINNKLRSHTVDAIASAYFQTLKRKSNS